MRNTLVGILLLEVAAGSISPAIAGPHALGAGMRWHREQSAFTELPFSDEDVSYAVTYEYHDKNAYWQIVADYAPEPSRTNTVDYVITPQLNLILADRIWRAGVGIMSSYLSSKDTGASEWTDVYWQCLAGIEFPVARLLFGMHAYYVFDQWKNWKDFEWADVEYAAWLRYQF